MQLDFTIPLLTANSWKAPRKPANNGCPSLPAWVVMVPKMQMWTPIVFASLMGVLTGQFFGRASNNGQQN
jgi:hypothetical protein